MSPHTHGFLGRLMPLTLSSKLASSGSALTLLRTSAYDPSPSWEISDLSFSSVPLFSMLVRSLLFFRISAMRFSPAFHPSSSPSTAFQKVQPFFFSGFAGLFLRAASSAVSFLSYFGRVSPASLSPDARQTVYNGFLPFILFKPSLNHHNAY